MWKYFFDARGRRIEEVRGVVDVGIGVLHKVFSSLKVGHDDSTIQGPVADGYEIHVIVSVAQHPRHVPRSDVVAVGAVKRKESARRIQRGVRLSWRCRIVAGGSKMSHCKDFKLTRVP